MANKRSTKQPTNKKRWPLAVLGTIALGVVLSFTLGMRRPPQMGADADVFKTVDALFTAITSHDPARLADCEQRLHAYREKEKLPQASAIYLDSIIQDARQGRWDPAARALYTFMEVQRREAG